MTKNERIGYLPEESYLYKAEEWIKVLDRGAAGAGGCQVRRRAWS